MRPFSRFARHLCLSSLYESVARIPYPKVNT
jgi:hypothetical protein